MVIAAATSLSLGPTSGQLCHSDGFCCSTSNGVTAGINAAWISSPADNFRGRASDLFCGRNHFLGLTQSHLSSGGRDPCLFKVLVAADYSDSVPDSTNYTSYRGYHPLEEVKVNKVRDTQLTPAEIARTAVEANSSALLVFPGGVHAEPHNEISWAEFQYVVDDYGDIFFEVFDNNNILNDRGAINPVNALIGMDMPMYENKRVASEYDVFSASSNDDIPFDDYYLAESDSEASDIAIDWGMPDNSGQIHPVYFAKCLTKAIDAEYDKKMDCPTNGVSIVGCLRPVFADDDTYLRRWPSRNEDSDGYISEWKDGEILGVSSNSNENSNYSTLYKLDIMRIELFSVYGVQFEITLEDFQDAEPDMLAHSTSAIIEHFSEKGIECDVALKALCKRKGIQIEAARLIGVDSLGMDVRILSGVDARTHRFPFKSRATCEGAAERQIQQLLFPRSRRKKFRSQGDRYYRDSKSF